MAKRRLLNLIEETQQAQQKLSEFAGQDDFADLCGLKKIVDETVKWLREGEAGDKEFKAADKNSSKKNQAPSNIV